MPLCTLWKRIPNPASSPKTRSRGRRHRELTVAIQLESERNPARIRATLRQVILLPLSLPESDLGLFCHESLPKTRLRFQIVKFGVHKNRVPTRAKETCVENKDESGKPLSCDKAVPPCSHHRFRSQPARTSCVPREGRVKSISKSASDSPTTSR